ncbi:transposase [Prevotella sp. CAG:617]|nr:transposase [Prevotella sp. CAG:617]
MAGNNSSNLIISQFAKRMGFSNIEKEMREIYEIKLSTSTIFIITNKVKHAA